ncbi:choice-of-anchor D domain-containing protein [Streptomyces sp. NBC_01017]|uniref:choice-of-anchor D domain-containing protein n=2 Tax=Streptomyces sp. NBC_01017 TaxID=2903721 RepID=UPI0038691CB2|nr:choice-of-anchor D domain-containing protein [Streptomyces sp. NBC_01017]WSV34868.1 choice-of-anchor D domain-containing protein [Streptomyces sp. NBC_01017]
MAVVVLTGVLTLSARSAPRVAAVEPSAAPGVVETMSRDVTGAARSGGDASVSADGRYVAFTSSEELDSDISTLRRNVYVRDRLAGETFLISRGQIVAGDRVFGEQSADGDSYAPSISADGRYVAFITTATNLHTGDTDRSPDVIICDRNPRGDGVFDQRAPTGFMDYRFVYAGKPTMVKGERITGNREAVPSLAAQGTAVAWQNVVPAASGGREHSEVFVTRLAKDQRGRVNPAGVHRVRVRVPGQRVVEASSPALSADGRDLVATVVLASSPTTGVSGVVGIDLATGRQSRLDVDEHHAPFKSRPGALDTRAGMPGAGEPVVSGSGRVVAFSFTPSPGAPSQVVLVDRDLDGNTVLGPGAGEETQSQVVSRDTDGSVVDGTRPGLSADGRYVAFVSTDPRAYGVEGPARGEARVVVRDRHADAERGRGARAGQLGQAVAVDQAVGTAGGAPVLSADGAVVAFTSAGRSAGDRRVLAHAFLPGLRASSGMRWEDTAVTQHSEGVLTLEHTGFGPLSIGAVRVGGVHGDDFQVLPSSTCRKAVLHRGDTCRVAVRFAPEAPGVRSAAVRVSFRGPGTGLTVPVRGLALAEVRSVSVDDEAPDFGARGVGGAALERPLTVTNSGTVPLTVSSAKINGPGHPDDYRITDNTCTTPLPPTHTCTLTLTHTPKPPAPATPPSPSTPPPRTSPSPSTPPAPAEPSASTRAPSASGPPASTTRAPPAPSPSPTAAPIP